MKCRKCNRNMQYRNIGNIYYFECPSCGYSIGKPTADTVVQPAVEEVAEDTSFHTEANEDMDAFDNGAEETVEEVE